MMMIGAAGRNAGKTELACSLIRRFGRDRRIVAVKVTVITERDGRCPRGGRGCGVCSSLEGNFDLTQEAEGPAGKDTTRLAAAGADKVYWLRVCQSHLAEAVDVLLDTIGRDAVCICESNRLRLAVQPGLFLMVKHRDTDDYKPSAAAVRDHVDRIVTFDGTGFDLAPSTIDLVDDRWALRRPVTAIILAGGTSDRMRRDKSLLPIGGRPMIEHVYRQLEPHFDQVLISANDPQKYTFLGVDVVPDEQAGGGPLMGMVCSLAVSANDLNFIVACDIPQIDMGFVADMLRRATDCDAVVPVTPDSHFEPLFAVYRKSTLPAMRSVLASGQCKITRFFDDCKIRYVALGGADWFTNLNTPDDYETYRKQGHEPTG